jgi:hypothetical protein
MPGGRARNVNIHRKRAVYFLVPKICGYSSLDDFARPTLDISGVAYSQKANDERERFSESQIARIIEALRRHVPAIAPEALSYGVYDFLDIFKEHDHFEELEAWAARLFYETRDGNRDRLPPKPAWPPSSAATERDKAPDILNPPLVSPAPLVVDTQRDSGEMNRDAMRKYYGTFFGFYICLYEGQEEHSKPAVAVDAYRIEQHSEKRDGTHALITQLTDIDTNDEPAPLPGYLRDRAGTVEIDLSQSLQDDDPNSFFMGSCPPQDEVQSMLLINLDISRGRRNTFARPTLFVRHDKVRIPKNSRQAKAETPLYLAVHKIIQTCMEFDYQRFMIAPKDRLERLSEFDERQMRKLIEDFIAELPADQLRVDPPAC